MPINCILQILCLDLKIWSDSPFKKLDIFLRKTFNGPTPSFLGSWLKSQNISLDYMIISCALQELNKKCITVKYSKKIDHKFGYLEFCFPKSKTSKHVGFFPHLLIQFELSDCFWEVDINFKNFNFFHGNIHKIIIIVSILYIYALCM